MQAWILGESPGDYRWGHIDVPEPRSGDVRVRVVASALNHMDLWLRRALPRPELPHVPGCDVAGVVESVGEGVGIAPGTEVVVNPAVSCRRCTTCLSGESPLCRKFGIVGEQRWGGHGELLVVPAANVVPRPQRSWEECAAYPLAYLTAWRMLRRARLEAGETLLVVGVGGGVSSAALVLGRALGARVFATSRDKDKRQRAIELGAEDAFDSSGDWPVRAHVVAENVGPATWKQAMKALAPGGRLVTCGGTSGTKVEVSLPRLFFAQHEIIGSTMGSYAEFDRVAGLVDDGLPVLVDEVFDLTDYPLALERLERGGQLGKIVLRHDAAA
jgi:zinc-binding alcohol dehydrogenase/oxidoreductase